MQGSHTTKWTIDDALAVDQDLVQLHTTYASFVNPHCHYDLAFLDEIKETIDYQVKLGEVLDDIEAKKGNAHRR